MPAGSTWHSLRQLVSMSSHTRMSIPLFLTHGSSNSFLPSPIPRHTVKPLSLHYLFLSQLQRSDTHCSGLAVGERKAPWGGGGNHELNISQTVAYPRCYARAIPSKTMGNKGLAMCPYVHVRNSTFPLFSLLFPPSSRCNHHK